MWAIEELWQWQTFKNTPKHACAAKTTWSELHKITSPFFRTLLKKIGEVNPIPKDLRWFCFI